MTNTPSQAKPGASDRHYLLSFFAHATGTLCILGFITLRLVDLPNLWQRGSTLWLVGIGDVLLVTGVILFLGRERLRLLWSITRRALKTLREETHKVFQALFEEPFVTKKAADPTAPSEETPQPQKGYAIYRRAKASEVPETIL